MKWRPWKLNEAQADESPMAVLVQTAATTGEIVCPLCSVVYYADVNAVGGAFVTETASIKPVTNRMIVFSPGVLHGVEEYTGTRMSVAVNPWAKPPMGYPATQTSEAMT